MPGLAPGANVRRIDLMESMRSIDTRLEQMGYIGHRLFPFTPVAAIAGTWKVIPIEYLLQNPETTRSRKAGYNELDFAYEELGWLCRDHGLKGYVDDEDHSTLVDPVGDMFDLLVHTMFLRFERAIVELATNSSLITEGDALTAPFGASGSTPVADIERAIQAAYQNSGLWPNTIAMSRIAFRNLRNDEEVVDRIKYQGFVDARAGAITESALAQLFDVDQVVVAGGSQNTKALGEDPEVGQIWPDDVVLIARIGRESGVREPCLGRTFEFVPRGGGLTDARFAVNHYRDAHDEGDWIRVRHQVDTKLIAPQCGYLLTGAVDSGS